MRKLESSRPCWILSFTLNRLGSASRRWPGAPRVALQIRSSRLWRIIPPRVKRMTQM